MITDAAVTVAGHDVPHRTSNYLPYASVNRFGIMYAIVKADLKRRMMFA